MDNSVMSIDILLKLYKRTEIEELLVQINNLLFTHRIKRLFVHLDYYDDKTNKELHDLIYKFIKVPVRFYSNSTNLGCSKSHWNSLDFIYRYKNVDNVLIIEDDLLISNDPIEAFKALNLSIDSKLYLVRLSDYYWSYISNRATYNLIKSTNLLDIDISDIHKELIQKLNSNNLSIIWDGELDLKLNYLKEIKVDYIPCFYTTGRVTSRSNETSCYVTKITYNNSKKIS